jgi:hypothetical protein
MLAKKTVKNQITLPKAIVEKLPNTDYFEVSLQGEEIVRTKTRSDRSQGHKIGTGSEQDEGPWADRKSYRRCYPLG